MKANSAVLHCALAALAAATAAVPVQAQVEQARSEARPLPRLVEKDGRWALLVDDAPYLIMGIEDLTMGDWPTRANVWNALEYMHVNTVEIAVYWQDFEPQPGQYDYAVIDRLLAEARAHNVRLIPLWFGTYKNGRQHYTPDWMKLDPGRYAHALDRNGQAVDSPSPFATASLEADKRAFAALLAHLKDVDPQRTVIMVQVENETGNWNSVRDFSPAADKQFKAPVPPEILKAKQFAAAGRSPDWEQAFGPDADEYFNAWAVARYVGQVAAAGKAVYPLPMVANVALRDPFHPGPPGVRGAPGAYESGGPTDNVLDIWKAAAPAIDILGPDVYQSNPAAYMQVLQLYHRRDNPLYLPETGCADCSRFLFAGLGLQTIGFSPATDVTRPALLGVQAGMAAAQAGNPDAWVDYKPLDEFLTSWGMDFRVIGPMQREIARLNFLGKLQGSAEVQGMSTEILPFGSWNAELTWGFNRHGGNPPGENPKPVGRALVAQLGDNQFLVTGYYCRVDFRPAGTEQQRKAQQIVPGTEEIPSALIAGRWQHRQFLRVDQVAWENGAFQRVRTWAGRAGEVSGLYFADEPVVLRVTVSTY
jgi:uncharacterized protein DUF5597/glycosyl hydrolase family 42 (putative beta-galactosidase)